MLPVPVTERVEFLSDAWIDVARQYLLEAAAREPAFANATFSICESFTDAPPHLGLPDNRAVWHFRSDGRTIEVGRGDLPGADVRIDADYQTVLAMAQTVYAAGPEAVARAQRELQHRAGPDAIKIAGRLDMEGTVGAALNG
jgi:hypothetical protein